MGTTLGVLLVLQTQLSSTAAPAPALQAGATSVRATRAAAPPVLDGSDEDAVWRSAPSLKWAPSISTGERG